MRLVKISYLLGKLERYDRTGGIAGGMFFWLPSLSVLVAHELLPDRIVLFLVLVVILSLIGVSLYLWIERKLTPSKKLLYGALGWTLSFLIILVYVNWFFQKM